MSNLSELAKDLLLGLAVSLAIGVTMGAITYTIGFVFFIDGGIF